MGMIPRIAVLAIICCFLIVSIPMLPSIPLLPSDLSANLVIKENELSQPTLSTFSIKNAGNVSWIWDEYANATGPLQGDDVLHWGPTLGPFHNYSEILAHIDDRVTEFPEFLDVFNIGVSYHGLPIPCIQITAPGDYSHRRGFLIVAHHHGREAITVENALYFLDYILVNSSQPAVQQILSTFVFYLIPTLNPDTLEILHINPWQRRNLHPVDDDGDGLADEWEIQDVNGDYVVDFYETEEEWYYTFEGIDLDGDGNTGEDKPGGVDLNRNYPIAFAYGVDEPRAEIYHGQAPFSEPETQAMRNFTVQYSENLVFALSLHSGIEVLATPWGHTDEPSHHEPFFANLGAAVEAASGYEWLTAIQLYPIFGSWMDWMYGEYGIPAVGLETYGNESAWGHSIWDYFNPSANEVLSFCVRVKDAIFAMVDVLLDEPGDPVIVVPSVVSSVISTLVSVYIDSSLSGFEILLLEYRYDPANNFNWIGIPLIHQGGNRYDAMVPAPLLGGIMELHVYGQDFAGHVIYSDSVSYSISASLFIGLVSISILLIFIIVVIIGIVIRRQLRKRT